MSNVPGRPVHQRLLIASYILGAVASLLATLGAIGSTVEQESLKYPNIHGPTPPPAPPGKEPTEASRRYFDM
jgi:hypothetical protein